MEVSGSAGLECQPLLRSKARLLLDPIIKNSVFVNLYNISFLTFSKEMFVLTPLTSVTNFRFVMVTLLTPFHNITFGYVRVSEVSVWILRGYQILGKHLLTHRAKQRNVNKKVSKVNDSLNILFLSTNYSSVILFNSCITSFCQYSNCLINSFLSSGLPSLYS